MQEISRENNFKTAKSIRAIVETFFYFASKKPIKKISVTEICNRAKVSRKTFYNNYLDIYDLIEKICARIAEESMSVILSRERLEEEFYKNFKSMTHFFRCEKVYDILPENHTFLLQKTCDMTLNLLKKYGAENNFDVREMAIKTNLIFAGIDGIYRYWYLSCKDLPITLIMKNVWELYYLNFVRQEF